MLLRLCGKLLRARGINSLRLKRHGMVAQSVTGWVPKGTLDSGAFVGAMGVACHRRSTERGATIAGVCWHQGNRIPHGQHAINQLVELIGSFREATKNPELPVIVGQLNCGVYGYQNGDWSVGLLREAQRRVAADDPRVVTFGLQMLLLVTTSSISVVGPTVPG